MEIQCLLQLGEKFSLPMSHVKEKDVINFIKQLENNLTKIQPNTAIEIRVLFVHKLTKFLKSTPPLNSVESQIIVGTNPPKDFLVISQI